MSRDIMHAAKKAVCIALRLLTLHLSSFVILLVFLKCQNHAG